MTYNFDANGKLQRWRNAPGSIYRPTVTQRRQYFEVDGNGVEKAYDYDSADRISSIGTTDINYTFHGMRAREGSVHYEYDKTGWI